MMKPLSKDEFVNMPPLQRWREAMCYSMKFVQGVCETPYGDMRNCDGCRYFQIIKEVDGD